ncbi:MAG TPA: Gfo/Idh/MocA family oxidoreductase [Chthoniobacteraceae bacterium]
MNVIDPSSAKELPTTKHAKPRLGFLGVGWIGQRRMQAIVEAGTAEIAAIADATTELAQEAGKLAPEAQILTSLDELLASDCDAMVISTPSALHAEQAIACLSRGLPVFCQKPLGRNVGEVRAIIDSARKADRLLGVDLSYRHVEGMQRIRELIQSGELGDIFGVELIFHNAFGPQKPWFYDPVLSGGGCVVDLGIHLVDAALWSLDTTVVGVTSRVLAQGKPLGLRTDTVEDFAVARLDLANGAVANLSCSWRLHAGRHAVIEAIFYGTNGGASLCNVGGSFHDFIAERFSGTSSERLSGPPDVWGGRAAVAWTRQLSESPAFDTEVERQIDVALALDAIYGRESARALIDAGRQ